GRAQILGGPIVDEVFADAPDGDDEERDRGGGQRGEREPPGLACGQARARRWDLRLRHLPRLVCDASNLIKASVYHADMRHPGGIPCDKWEHVRKQTIGRLLAPHSPVNFQDPSLAVPAPSRTERLSRA